jgi:ribosomal protein L22
MSAEEEKNVTPQEAPAAKEPAGKNAARKKAPGAKAAEGKKPAAKKVAAKKAPAKKEPAAAKEPVAEKKASRTKEPAKAPRRRVVRAHARYVRTSARKARMVCGHLRGKTVGEARAILAFTPRDVARDWSKLLESAVANAESNHELLEDDLIVREAYADEGPTIKRFRPRAMGRATPIRKRTSHLTIALTPGAEPRTTKRHG